MDKYGNKIIAVDFDKTLSMARYPEVGEPNIRLFNYLKAEKEKGSKIILNSCRTKEPLIKAVEFCNENGLIFDAINDNVDTMIETFGDNPRKISADVYIDDKAVKPFTDAEYLKRYDALQKMDILTGQIEALLDLMQMCEDLVDIKSIKTASEMCVTMLDDLKNEISKITILQKEQRYCI